MESIINSRQPFGLSTTCHGNHCKKANGIKICENEGISYATEAEISRNLDIVNKYKVFIPQTGSGSDSIPHPILGKPFVGELMSACSETYIFIGPFESENQCRNVMSYISTRFCRFLSLLKKVTQSTTRSIYTFVPQQDFTKPWTDEVLYRKYDLTENEIAFIESMVRPMDLGGEKDA